MSSYIYPPPGAAAINGQDISPRSVSVGPYGAFLADGVTPTPSGVEYGNIWDFGGEAYNVLAAGGVAADSGTTDNGPGFQRAATAAIARGAVLVIPAPAVLGQFYGVATTISLVPPSGAAFSLHIRGAGSTIKSAIQWTGADNSKVFSALGWKRSTVMGVFIGIVSPSSGVVAWDLDVDATRTSTGILIFQSCNVNMTSGATANYGWRLGHLGGATGGSEMSFIKFIGCQVNANAQVDGNFGWQDEHSNGLVHSWYGCGSSFLTSFYRNDQSAGAASGGSGSKYFYGCGGSDNAVDFFFAHSGIFLISGGRFEVGTQLVLGTWGSTAAIVILDGVEIGTYAGDGAGAVIRTNAGAGTVILRGVHAYGATYAATFVTVNAGAGRPSTLVIEGCLIQTISDPCYSITGPWTVWVRGSSQINSGGQPTTALTERYGTFTASNAVTYSTTPTPDIRVGILQKLTVTDGVAFALQAPATNFDGAELIWDIFNNSGGAIGAITVVAAYLLAGGTAFVGPGNGKRRVIAFRYDSTAVKWIEIWRTTADT